MYPIDVKVVTDSQNEQLIMDGLRFLESITRVYGAEEGQQVWLKIGEALGDDLKGQIFFRMLTGESASRVWVQAATCTQAVAAIKAIRSAAGLGLKEAKDIWDMSKEQPVKIEVTGSSQRRELIATLRGLGMVVY